MEQPSFSEFADFLCQWGSISRRKVISRNTQFESDRGITGDDGCELLEATEQRFHVRLSSEENGYRETFNLGPDEFLFNSEGFLFGLRPLITRFGNHDPIIRAFTVGELYDAVCKAIESSIRS